MCRTLYQFAALTLAFFAALGAAILVLKPYSSLRHQDSSDDTDPARPRDKKEPDIPSDKNQKVVRGILFAPSFLIGYSVGVILLLGWSAYRQYLNVWRIDPTGVDAASAEITINYLGFGVRSAIFAVSSIISSWIPAKPGSVLYNIFLILLVILAFLVHIFFHRRNLLSIMHKKANKFVNIYLLILLVIIPLSFPVAVAIGDFAGQRIAHIQQNEPLLYFHPVTFTYVPIAGNETVYDTEKGCWLLLKQDKKNLYIFNLTTDDDYDKINEAPPTVFTFALDKVRDLRNLARVITCPFNSEVLRTGR